MYGQTDISMRYMFVTVYVLSVALHTEGIKLCEKKCFLGQQCWPQQSDWAVFASKLDGDFFSPSHPHFALVNTMKNARVLKAPGGIVFAKTVQDIEKSVNFARKFNIRVSVMSSGHSFIGRSTDDGNLVINLSRMKKMKVSVEPTKRSPGGEVTLESGNTWGRIYEELEKYDRVIVGGSAHTVAVGGYTQGGGHSPMSRSLGLAVDNLLEVELVTVDGQHLRVSEKGTYNVNTGARSKDANLFWALRGGGGGTWGAIVTFTFKLHIPPRRFLHFTAFYPLFYKKQPVGHDYLYYILRQMVELPQQWGGNVVLTTTNYDKDTVGGVLVSLLHYGPSTAESAKAIQPLLNDSTAVFTNLAEKTSFWDYAVNLTDTDVSYMRIYMANAVIQKIMLKPQLVKDIVFEMFDKLSSSTSACSITLLGGKANDVDTSKTPINPALRSASFSISCTRLWDDAANDPENIELSIRFCRTIRRYGLDVYFNEPAEHLSGWKDAFWGNEENYNKLLQTKKKWDPSNFFCCHNCVGSDLEEKEESVIPTTCSAHSVHVPPVIWVIFAVLRLGYAIG